jgi:CPA1 family monovalent cation:H+ antiporter
MEFLELQIFVLVLIIISAVAILVSYIRLPYTIALVIVGLIIGHFKLLPSLQFTPGLFTAILLPVLIFEGALNIPLIELKRSWRTILLLAIPGFLLAMLICSLVINLGIGMEWSYAFLLGALISATDPVSVLAIFQRLGIDKRLTVTLEGESLLNDGIAIVVFEMILLSLSNGKITILGAIGSFLWVAVGGLALGLLLGIISAFILRRIENHLVHATITAILVYSAVLLAGLLHESGIIAVLVAGIVVGNYGFKGRVASTSKITINTIWEFSAFLVNSIIFLFMGIKISDVSLISYIIPILIAFGATLLSRSAMIYSLTPLGSWWEGKIPASHRHVLVWGGLRGSVALALVLSIPKELPEYNQMLSITFGIVLLSLLLQGLTINPLLHLLGLSERTRKREKASKKDDRAKKTKDERITAKAGAKNT